MHDQAGGAPDTTGATRHWSPTLLGVAIDVSGSMQESIRNDSAADFSRLGGVSRGMRALLDDSRRLARRVPGGQPLPLRLFGYAFGLTVAPEFIDLAGVVRFARALGTDPACREFFEQSKARRRAAAEAKGRAMAAQAGGLGSVLGGLGGLLGSVAREVEAKVRRQLTQEATAAVLRDVLDYIDEHFGDSTLTVDELAALWGGGGLEGDSLGEASQLIFGGTPLCGCLREVAARFERERAVAPAGEQPILLLVSDGAPTDGSPLTIASELRERGVQVACAFVTDRDVQAPRELPRAQGAGWSSGARLLFDMASPIDAVDGGESPWRPMLSRSGWSVPDGARLFLQVNHSETLADFMRLVATAFPARHLASLTGPATAGEEQA